MKILAMVVVIAASSSFFGQGNTGVKLVDDFGIIPCGELFARTDNLMMHLQQEPNS